MPKQSEVIQGVEKEFLDIFHSLCGSRSSWQVWEDLITVMACSISNAVDKNPDRWDKREKEYERCIKDIGSVEIAAKAFAVVVNAYTRNPDQDFLGAMYMQLGLGSHWHGQFFTPYSVTQLMAKMTIGTSVEDAIGKQGYASVSDCACGAGATLIAAANAFKEKGIDYQRDVMFVAQDIDSVVAKMCYIQLSLLGCPGYVVIANSLTNPVIGPVITPVEQSTQEFWYTPFYFRNEWCIRRMREALGLMKIFGDEEPKKIELNEKYFFYFDFEQEEQHGN